MNEHPNAIDGLDVLDLIGAVQTEDQAPERRAAPVARTSMLDHALRLHELGLNVIPLRFADPADRKKPLLPWERWQTERQPRKFVEETWQKHPQAGIAIVTGAVSNVVAVDADSNEAKIWIAANLPPTPMRTDTPPSNKNRSGGQHLFYRHPGPRVPNRVKIKPDGQTLAIDVRGDGGYVVAAPSFHPEGGQYAEDGDWAIRAHGLPAFDPAWLDANAASVPRQAEPPASKEEETSGQTSPYGAAALKRAVASVASSEEGGRNDNLFRQSASIGALVAGGEIKQSAAFEELLHAAVVCGLPQQEAEATIASGFKAGAAKPRSAPKGRFFVVLDPNKFHLNVETCVEVLIGDPDLFEAADGLVCLLRDPRGGAHRVKGVSAPQLRERMARGITFSRPVDDKWQAAPPPRDIADTILARGHWADMRYLVGTVGSPILRPDGTLCDVPGYDKKTQLYFSPTTPFPPIPDRPSLAEAKAALDELAAVFKDFPWRSRADLAAALAAILTAIGRAAIDGPCPGILLEANVRGAGKSLAARLIGHIAVGAPIAAAAWSEDSEEERRKTVLAHLADGHAVTLLDNLQKPIHSAALDRVLTTTRYSDRVLGVSKTAAYDVRTVFLLTANNAVVRGDTVRRLLVARLESPLEKPEDRSEKEFAQPRIEAFVAKNRERLVAAALTALRAWFVAGQPSADLPNWGSFEGWSHVIRNTLVWAGWPDPIDTRADLRAAEAEDLEPIVTLHDAIFRHAAGRPGLTSAEIAHFAHDDPELNSALASLGAAPPGERSSAKTVGYLLRRLKYRVVQDRRLEPIGKKPKEGIIWAVKGNNIK